MVSVNGSSLTLTYRAKNVNLVASGNNTTIGLRLDGSNLTQQDLGSDAHLVGNTAVAVVGQCLVQRGLNPCIWLAHVGDRGELWIQDLHLHLRLSGWGTPS